MGDNEFSGNYRFLVDTFGNFKYTKAYKAIFKLVEDQDIPKRQRYIESIPVHKREGSKDNCMKYQPIPLTTYKEKYIPNPSKKLDRSLKQMQNIY